MAIYNAYLEGAERDAAIFNMEINNQYDKLSLLYEMSLMELEQVKKDIELKVFRESGTYDDYEYLVSEAEAQAAQDQGNILTQIFDWFRNLLNKVITGIKNLFSGNKVDPNTQIEMIDDPNAQAQTSAFNQIMNTINSAQDQNSVLGLPKAIAGVVAAVAAGATVGGLFVLNRAAKKKKATVKDATSESNACAKNATTMLKAIDKLDALKEQFKNLPVIGQVVSTISDTCGTYLRPIANFFKDKADYLQELIGAAATNAKNTATAAVDAVKGAVGKTLHGNKTEQVNDAVGVTSATPDGNNTRLKVSYVDKSSGKAETKRTTVNLDGVVSDKTIPAKVRLGIQNSQTVKDALAAIKTAAAKKTPQSTTTTQPTPQPTATQPAQPVTASAEDLQIELGDDYTVEVADDGAIEITINTVIECPEDYISTTQSIFGMIAEEEASEDPELEELQKLFEEL